MLSKKAVGLVSDVRGVTRLAIDATTAVTDLVEAMHHTIGHAPSIFGRPPQGRAKGVTGLVYCSIRGMTGAVGSSIDAILARLSPALEANASSEVRDAILAALNGVLRDHLAATQNPLAVSMRMRMGGTPVALDRGVLQTAIPKPTGKLLLLVHGLCMNGRQWLRNGHDHGTALAHALGYTPVYLDYNTGLHVSTNGATLSAMMDVLLRAWPVPVAEMAIIGHSMGGLVARSACFHAETAGHDWRDRLRQLIFLGTPHHGAPLERGGHWIDIAFGLSPYTAPFAGLGQVRGAGITDLRFGNLLDADWQGRDRFERSHDTRQPAPLPQGVACYAIGATTARRAGTRKSRMVGDGLVPLASALGQHEDPARDLGIAKERRWVAAAPNHLDLLSRAKVCARMRQWLAPTAKGTSV